MRRNDRADAASCEPLLEVYPRPRPGSVVVVDAAEMLERMRRFLIRRRPIRSGWKIASTSAGLARLTSYPSDGVGFTALMLRRRQSDRQSQKQTFAIRGANRERSAGSRQIGAPPRSQKSALTTSGGDDLHDKPALSVAAVLSTPVGFTPMLSQET